VDGNKNKYACLDCNKIESQVKGGQGDFEVTVTPDGEVQHRSSVTVVVQNNKVLFLERKNYPYSLSFPGGHVMYEDEGDLKQAALRELREESGIIATADDLIHLITFPLVHQQCHASPDIEIWNMYLLRLPDGPMISVVTDEEHNGHTWVAVGDVPSLTLSLSANEAISMSWNRVIEELNK
jgi:8-oxo-dGTP pyrophosphatase MutT (NUDIX family)